MEWPEGPDLTPPRSPPLPRSPSPAPLGYVGINSAELEVRLNNYLERLKTGFHQRDFNTVPSPLPSRSGSCTPPFPNPFHPLERWRYWAQQKQDELYRKGFGTDHRKMITSVEYWNSEIGFWRSAF